MARSESSFAWHEPVRLGAAFAITMISCLWLYPQELFWYQAGVHGLDAVHASEIVTTAARTAWVGSFFQSLAVGIAWYVFSRLRPTRSRALLGPRERMAVGGALGALCVPLCGYLLHYRLLFLFVTGFDALVDGAFRSQLQWLGILTAGVAFNNAWGLVPALGGRRRSLLLLTGASLLGGGLGYASLVPERFTVPPEFRPRYLATHTDEGALVGDLRLRRNWFASWGQDPTRIERMRCTLCLIPATRLFVTEGISLRLSAGRPETSRASHIVEIPRGGTTARVFGDGPMRVVPLDRVAEELAGCRRAILKIDFLREPSFVRELLRGFGEHGVRRVDLAVTPRGLHPAPSHAPRIDLQARTGDLPYPGRPSEDEPPIVVKKYLPPDPEEDPRQRCREVFPDEVEAAAATALDPAGSLPARVALRLDRFRHYGALIGALQGAVAGGAETIVLDDSPDSPSP